MLHICEAQLMYSWFFEMNVHQDAKTASVLSIDER